jgi:hypothetical protein
MRCPVDEIGRNSVKPSTTPRMMQQRHGRCFSLEPCFVSVAKSHMRQALKAFSNAKVLAEVHEGGRQQHPRIIDSQKVMNRNRRVAARALLSGTPSTSKIATQATSKVPSLKIATQATSSPSGIAPVVAAAEATTNAANET